MSRSSVRVALGASLLAAAVALPAAAQSPQRIAVFDPQRVSEETAEGKRIQVQLAGVRDERQKEISDEEAELQRLQQQLGQQALSLSPEKRSALEVDIRRRLLALNLKKEMANQGFQLEISAAESQFNEKLRNVVVQFAKDEGFDLILESAMVAYASAGTDVTTAIIDVFDRMYPAATAEAPAAP